MSAESVDTEYSNSRAWNASRMCMRRRGHLAAGDKPISSTRREDMVLAPDANGRQRHIRSLDEKLVHRNEVGLESLQGAHRECKACDAQ